MRDNDKVLKLSKSVYSARRSEADLSAGIMAEIPLSGPREMFTPPAPLNAFFLLFNRGEMFTPPAPLNAFFLLFNRGEMFTP
jgi:hypothetical protein